MMDSSDGHPRARRHSRAWLGREPVRLGSQPSCRSASSASHLRLLLAMDTGAAAGAHAEGEMVSGPSWFLLRGVLAQEQQLRLFSFIRERDATD